MTAVEHIIAWIESSRPHYDRLLQLEQERKNARSSHVLAYSALNIVADAYREAVHGGDMFVTDHTPQTLLDAAKALLEWELEQ